MWPTCYFLKTNTIRVAMTNFKAQMKQFEHQFKNVKLAYFGMVKIIYPPKGKLNCQAQFELISR